MVCSKVTVKITIRHIKVVFGNFLMQKHWYYPTTSIWCTKSKILRKASWACVLMLPVSRKIMWMQGKASAACLLMLPITLKFLNRYAANIKWAVNIDTDKLNGLKSHGYHIFIERLMLVMFYGYFKSDLWKMFAKLSYFYRQICAKQVSKAMM
jgi:hypothetical protein